MTRLPPIAPSRATVEVHSFYADTVYEPPPPPSPPRVLCAPDDTYLEPNGPRPRFSALQRQPVRAGRGRQRPRLPPLERKAAETRSHENRT